jgi:integrase
VADGGDSDREVRGRIGLRQVRAVRPGQTIWDTTIMGLGIRRQQGDTVSYILQYRHDGRRRLYTIGKHGSPWTPDTARAEALRLLGEIVRGIDPVAERKARRAALSTTIADLCDRYVEDAEAGRLLTRRRVPKKVTTLATDRSRITSHIKPLIGRIPVISLTRQDVERVMHQIAEGATAKRCKLPKAHALSNIRGGHGTATRTIGLLGAIMSHAVRLGLRDDNPVHQVVRRADGRRERRLSFGEYARLGAALIAAEDDGVHPRALAAIRFLALTGWRRGEVLNLRWTEIDLERRTARLTDTKTGPSMRPLAEPSCAILRAMPCGEFVFQAMWADAPMQDIVRPWRKVMGIAELGSDVTPHTLRHSLASVAADLQFGDATIASLLGHKGHGITRRYIHSADAVLLAAADAVAKEIERMMVDNTGTT